MCNIAVVFICFLIKHHWIYCVSTGSGNYAWEEMDRRDPMRLGLNQNFCELSHQNVSLNIFLVFLNSHNLIINALQWQCQNNMAHIYLPTVREVKSHKSLYIVVIQINVKHFSETVLVMHVLTNINTKARYVIF